jgi:hypothetical protein
MGTVSVLNTVNMASGLQQPDLGKPNRPSVSLLAFLQAENLRLKIRVAELQHDTTALREALQHN